MKKPDRLFRAISFVEDAVRNAAGSDDFRLPSIRAMARECGVSLPTMTKAVAVYRKNGSIASIARGGLVVTAALRSVASDRLVRSRELPERETRSEVLVRRITEDITRGIYTPGNPLPSKKELVHRYGSSYRPVEQALRRLSSNGQIVPYKRGYTVYQTPLPRSNATVVFVASSDSMELLGKATPWSSDFWRYLGRDCMRRGLVISVFSMGELVRSTPPGNDRFAAVMDGTSCPVIGFVVYTLGFRQEELERVKDLLDGTGRNVCYIDEIGRLDFSACCAAAGRGTAFQLGCGVQPGIDVGEFLLGRGFMKVAYFSLFRDDRVHENRKNGIRTVYSRAGFDQDVILDFCSNRFGSREELDRMIFGRRDYGKMIAATKRLRSALGKTGLQSPFYLDYLQFFRSAYVLDMMNELFRGAIAVEDCDAWVTGTDEFGIYALSFLKTARGQRKRRIPVISFDDTIEAFAANLTSYNFNVPGLVHSIMDHLTNGKRGAVAGIEEVKGLLMVRQSSL